ncbi:retron Eco8 family effector endonuclease [Aliarcobacter vitoriensis]|uniref:ATPase AAA-type core domain-containing protein n=1 Tax=Aliarcobacter vitoriensis TaxID=2011099 RepID=A0A366MSM0_9BACT|nr:retron Eco8 family effector endonuclease [Aliarcobacter vitoriensis]RBQ29235.1 hypothetical protein CRU91_05235 [Aliarcobacter vitoriensis]
MPIKSIKIKNILSFEDLYVDRFEEINCIIGRNNVGKSNLLKVIRYFYQKLTNERVLPLELNSNYSSFGMISIEYDTSFLSRVVSATKNINIGYFQKIKEKLIKYSEDDILILELFINSDDSIRWNIEDKELRNIIVDIFPFFDLPSRYIEPKDWSKLWHLISRLKPFNPHKIKIDRVKEFFDTEINSNQNYKTYSNYIGDIEKYLEIDRYKHSDKVLNFVKSGLRGERFLIDSKSIDTQSDGTNTYKFLEAFLSLMIVLTKKSYISPIVYIDEPEIGFHPKRSEEFIEKIYDLFSIHTYNRPYPNIFIATHSPSIVKQVIKLFKDKHQILHFSKDKKEHTMINKMNSKFEDERFLNIFGDNEARLFFSRFILFVEGETELEIFANQKLKEFFPVLKRIDVYKSSSNVLSSSLNPSYNNSSIPYLYLYDADKIYNFKRDGKKRGIILQNKNKFLYTLPDSKDCSIEQFRKESKAIRYGHSINLLKKYNKYLNTIELFHGKKYNFNNFYFSISDINFHDNVKAIKKYLILHRVFFVNTTIEGSLINNHSSSLFFEWIKLEYSILPKSFLYLKTLKNRRYITDELLVLYFRILFDGKFETQIDYKILINSKTNFKAKFLLKSLNKYISKQNKTSGWTTKFLNYSLNTIEKECKKNDSKEKDEEFRNIFKQKFGELFDIITLVEKSLSDR